MTVSAKMLHSFVCSTLLATVVSIAMLVADASAQGAGGRSVTQGLAKKVIDNLYRTNFPELFERARWIWTLNLVFDNLVLARKTVK
jgi:hypothetical protein